MTFIKFFVFVLTISNCLAQKDNLNNNFEHKPLSVGLNLEPLAAPLLPYKTISSNSLLALFIEYSYNNWLNVRLHGRSKLSDPTIDDDLLKKVMMYSNHIRYEVALEHLFIIDASEKIKPYTGILIGYGEYLHVTTSDYINFKETQLYIREYSSKNYIRVSFCAGVRFNIFRHLSSEIGGRINAGKMHSKSHEGLYGSNGWGFTTNGYGITKNNSSLSASIDLNLIYRF